MLLMMGVSLNAQEVSAPAQQTQTVSQAACGSYTINVFDQWGQYVKVIHCTDFNFDQPGWNPLIHFQSLESGAWETYTVTVGHWWDVIDNGDGSKSGHAGLSVDNPQPFLLTYDAEGFPDEVILLHHAFHHYGPDGNIDGWIIQRAPGDPWEIVPYTSVWLLKP